MSIRIPYTCLVSGILIAGGLCQTALAKTSCVDPKLPFLCYSSIQAAVDAASSGETIVIAPGTYSPVKVWKSVSLLGLDAKTTIIDATGKPTGVYVDGYDYPGLQNVTVTGLTIENAQFEGVLIVSASHVTIQGNSILNNDQFGAVFNPNVPNCSGQPSFETDESGDCGGAIHLIGTTNVTVSFNNVTGNADGVLISDETGESSNNTISYNSIVNNPKECGIVLASHPPAGEIPPVPYTAHHGVDNNRVEGNLAQKNGVTVGGSGVGLFSDGNGPGKVSGNVIIGNILLDNGIPGVALHTHVGPAFNAPADDMSNNQILDNYIAGNGADTEDTATPGTAGINISSGMGGSPVTGTVISGNIIRDEQFDIVFDTPNAVGAQRNDLLGGMVGVADGCPTLNGNNSPFCTTTIDATNNYWGCSGGPGAPGCSTVSGSTIQYKPWLTQPVAP